MLGAENMQIVTRLLELTLGRWCSHRAKKEVCQPAKSVADSLPPAPLVQIGYKPFILHNLFPAQAMEERTLP